MILYKAPGEKFITDVKENKIDLIVAENFQEYYGHTVGRSELNSWNNSSQFISNIIEKASINEATIVMEYELPYTNERIDYLFFAKDSSSQDNAVILEVKQWSDVSESSIDENVITYVGHGERMIPHPSYQVRGYHYHLEDFISCFEEDPKMILSSCAYCHNYLRTSDSVLYEDKFKGVLQEFPLFAKQDYIELGEFLKNRLSSGKGLEVYNRFINSPLKPSKKLVDYASQMIRGQRVFNLLNEQITANNTIIDRAKKSHKLKNKSVIIVRGGPGTGKSVIALNSLSELLSHGLVVYHATGSLAFTSTLRKVVGPRVEKLFKYFNSFQNLKGKTNDIDVLICDEAHRIRKTSNSRYTKKEFRSEIPQIDELIKIAKVSIFFIDDDQTVRPDEIGSSDLIRKSAINYDAEIFEFKLETQFRCNGSDGYLSWIDNTLRIRETANLFLTKDEKIEFRIFDTPHALYEEIKKKNDKKINSARLVAGFCWPWSDSNPDGSLVKDVVIDDFQMTWEAKNEARKLAPGIPLAKYWAYDTNGVNQIGSIYTVQGFEFEYIGIIFGKDLMYDPIKGEWIGYPENSADSAVKRDKENFLRLVKNTYRVLMTRGMKGCYVYFQDKETEKYFKSRLEI